MSLRMRKVRANWKWLRCMQLVHASTSATARHSTKPPVKCKVGDSNRKWKHRTSVQAGTCKATFQWKGCDCTHQLTMMTKCHQTDSSTVVCDGSKSKEQDLPPQVITIRLQ
eukprot:4171833-Amphidinium_carterae.1